MELLLVILGIFAFLLLAGLISSYRKAKEEKEINSNETKNDFPKKNIQEIGEVLAKETIDVLEDSYSTALNEICDIVNDWDFIKYTTENEETNSDFNDCLTFETSVFLQFRFDWFLTRRMKAIEPKHLLRQLLRMKIETDITERAGSFNNEHIDNRIKKYAQTLNFLLKNSSNNNSNDYLTIVELLYNVYFGLVKRAISCQDYYDFLDYNDTQNLPPMGILAIPIYQDIEANVIMPKLKNIDRSISLFK